MFEKLLGKKVVALRRWESKQPKYRLDKDCNTFCSMMVKLIWN